MKTVVFTVDPHSPNAEAIAEAARVLRAGGLVAFPTETVYGLGANALDASAVARIFAAKGRPANNPLIVHVAESAAAQQVAADWPDTAALLAERSARTADNGVAEARSCARRSNGERPDGGRTCAGPSGGPGVAACRRRAPRRSQRQPLDGAVADAG
jgi:hypothetical protein